MRRRYFAIGIALATAVVISVRPGRTASGPRHQSSNHTIQENASDKLAEGRQVFRFATFGDEAFWGDSLKLHQAIEGSKFGGVGPGVSPSTALAVGLKVDVDALPGSLISSRIPSAAFIACFKFSSDKRA